MWALPSQVSPVKADNFLQLVTKKKEEIQSMRRIWCVIAGLKLERTRQK